MTEDTWTMPKETRAERLTAALRHATSMRLRKHRAWAMSLYEYWRDLGTPLQVRQHEPQPFDLPHETARRIYYEMRSIMVADVDAQGNRVDAEGRRV